MTWRMESPAVHEYVNWKEERLATSRLPGVLVRLNLPHGGHLPHHLAGRVATHQVGMWTSSIHRPRGRFRYAGQPYYHEMKQATFVPAEIDWVAEVEESGPLKPAIFCDFDNDYIYETTGIDPHHRTEQLMACENGDVSQQALRLLADELRAPGFSHAVKVDSLCRLILVELARQLDAACSHAGGGGKGKLAPWQLGRIRDLAETVEGRPLTVCQLAQECGISPAHLRRLFKASTGTSVSTYVDGIRLDRAKALLADRTLPLKGIAHRLGFASASAFSAAFKREAGTSPNRYRQQIIA